MSGPDLSRRLGRALGRHDVTPQERRRVTASADAADAWMDLPGDIRRLVEEIERRPGGLPSRLADLESRQAGSKAEGSSIADRHVRVAELPDLLRQWGLLPAEDPTADEPATVAVTSQQARNLLAAFNRVAGTDTHPGGESLKHYWTKDPEGLAKWATKPHPWTSLYHELVKHMSPEKAKRVTSAWYEDVFGMPVGMKKGKNPHGPG